MVSEFQSVVAERAGICERWNLETLKPVPLSAFALGRSLAEDDADFVSLADAG